MQTWLHAGTCGTDSTSMLGRKVTIQRGPGTADQWHSDRKSLQS